MIGNVTTRINSKTDISSGDLIFSREKWPRFFLSFFLFLVEGQRSLVTRFSFPSRLLISLSGFVVSGKTVVPLRGGGRKKKKRKKGREGRKGSRFSHISPSSSHSPSTPCPFLVIRLTTAVRSVYFEACTRECPLFLFSLPSKSNTILRGKNFSLISMNTYQISKLGYEIFNSTAFGYF